MAGKLQQSGGSLAGLLRSSAFMRPLRMTDRPYWAGHIPFAGWLVDVSQPRTLVELGTETGVSYCAFCQAIAAYAGGSRAYAVDSWAGDSHTGVYGGDVLASFRAHHDPLYSDFSTIIVGRFESAVGGFDDGSIDILHIDGFHTYGSVKSDFEMWLPKVSRRGIVLLHDINVQIRDFGVWKLWDELKIEYRAFEFLHASGLGVLVPHDAPCPEIDWLVDLEGYGTEAALVRSYFERLGEPWTLEAPPGSIEDLGWKAVLQRIIQHNQRSD
jgi:hypothetical protein